MPCRYSPSCCQAFRKFVSFGGGGGAGGGGVTLGLSLATSKQLLVSCSLRCVMALAEVGRSASIWMCKGVAPRLCLAKLNVTYRN